MRPPIPPLEGRSNNATEVSALQRRDPPRCEGVTDRGRLRAALFVHDAEHRALSTPFSVDQRVVFLIWSLPPAGCVAASEIALGAY
jgi:hypothetical protein